MDNWNRALEALQKELNPQAFERWLRPIKPLESTGAEIILGVPDEFFKSWVIDHYGNLIVQVLKEITGSPDSRISFQTLKDELSSAATSPPVPAAASLHPLKGVESPAATAHVPQQPEFSFNPKYTFDSFVVGPSNRFAHAASMAIAASPAKAYNPLFIYGPVGLGKTHLMQAIGQEILKTNSKARVLYITSEMFTNQLINAIRTGTTIQFREKYRTVDCLLIDDIHFIAGKEATMEGFFHTFNALYDAHKQIVASSDKSPKEISNLEERLVSRFEWGLVTDIQPPDFETRIAILQKKAEKENLYIPDSVTTFIADKIKSNIRELEGALIRVVAYSKLVSRVVDESAAQEVLKDLIMETQKKITVDHIQRKVAEYFEIRLSDMTAKRRLKNIVYPRHIAMYLSRQLMDLSFPEIGEQFGGRDHTTILHACSRIKKDIRKDLKIKSLVDKLTIEIQKR